MSWILPEDFPPVRDPNLQAPTEFILPNGDRYNNPRRMSEKWLRTYLKREPAMLAIDVIRAWDKTHAVEQRFKRWILISNLISAVLGILLVIAKFFR
jgi:hypothetical protein